MFYHTHIHTQHFVFHSFIVYVMMRNELKTLYYLIPESLLLLLRLKKSRFPQSEINIPPPFERTPKKQNMTHLIECTCYLVTSKHTQISFSLTPPSLHLYSYSNTLCLFYKITDLSVFSFFFLLFLLYFLIAHCRIKRLQNLH